MTFTITDSITKPGRRMFSQHEQTLRVAYLHDRGYTFGFSRWDDEEYWYADTLIAPNGAPHFVHGEGGRECAKSPATPEVQEALDKHFGF